MSSYTSGMFNATLIQRIEVTPDLLIIRVKPDAGVPNFEAGQYVALALPGSHPRPESFPAETESYAPDKLIKRAYSIGSSPAEKGYLEFYIAIVPTGALTSRLVTLKEGDRLFCAPKITGHFTLHDIPEGKNLILIATGTGLAPYMSMLRTGTVVQKYNAISILHGVRFERDLAYREELASFTQQNPRFKYHAFVSREDAKPGLFQKGYVQSVFMNGEITPDPVSDHVLVCGNPAMIEDVEKLLTTERGYIVHSKKTPGSLHVEKYW